MIDRPGVASHNPGMVCVLPALRSARLTTVSFLCVMGFTCSAHAQIPPTGEASRATEELKSLAIPQKEPLKPVGESPLPLQEAPDGAAEMSFTLTGVTLKGVTAYPDGQLDALFRDKIGTDVSLMYLFDLANAITVKYRNDGYILSRAVVPQQEIRDGHVTLEIVEGYISGIIINGAPDEKANTRIQTIAANVTQYRPVNIADIERYLLLIRDMAGFNVESLIQPADDGVGAADLVLQVDHDKLMVSAGLDNYGTKFLGPVQGTLRVQGNSLLRTGDRTVARYIATDGFVPWNQQELRYFDVSHSTPISDEGTMLTVSATHALAYPGNSLEPLDAKSRNTIFSIEASHPFIRSRQSSLFGAVKFDMIHTGNELSGTTFADDRLRVLRANASFDYADSWNGITQITGEISKGLDIFGASDTSSPELSRARGESRFLKFNVDAARLQKLFNNVNLYAAVRGQFSNDRLLSAEEFGVGGGLFGRGYDNSEITGDRGYAGKLELQYNGNAGLSYLRDYQAFVFYDAGKVFQSDGKAGNDASIASAGAGVRFNMNDNFSGSLTLARPLTKGVDSDNGDKDWRGYFSLSVRY